MTWHLYSFKNFLNISLKHLPKRTKIETHIKHTFKEHLYEYFKMLTKLLNKIVYQIYSVYSYSVNALSLWITYLWRYLFLFSTFDNWKTWALSFIIVLCTPIFQNKKQFARYWLSICCLCKHENKCYFYLYISTIVMKSVLLYDLMFHSVTLLFTLFVFLFMTSFLNKILKRKMLSDFSTSRKFEVGMFASSVACNSRTITREFVERKSRVVHLICLRVIACDAVHTTIFF